jgi:dTDP-4-amino-4,6-dideoxygalactose transaminase
MVVGRDPLLAECLRKLRIHGGLRAYDHERVGWNSRLDALQAAVLRVKLPRLESWCRARAANAARYDGWLTEAGLVASGRVRLPHRDPRCGHIFNQYTLRVEDRDGLRAKLERRGIGHAVYYPIALHLEPCFHDLGHRPGDFPEAESAAREVISLPVFPELRPEQQERVVAALADFYGGRSDRGAQSSGPKISDRSKSG